MTGMEVLVELFGYGFVSMYVVTIILLASWGVLSLLGRFRTRGRGARAIKKVATVVIGVALVGAVGDVIWLTLFDGWLYVAPDSIVEFSPFIPFRVNIGYGGHLLRRVAWLQVELLWAAFAAICWLTSWAVCHRFSSQILAALDRFLGSSPPPIVRSPGKDTA
jgi:hypothetical protein